MKQRRRHATLELRIVNPLRLHLNLLKLGFIIVRIVAHIIANTFERLLVFIELPSTPRTKQYAVQHQRKRHKHPRVKRRLAILKSAEEQARFNRQHEPLQACHRQRHRL